MKINKITLFNFGSYEGLTEFNTNTNKDRNIILIGGKNGAGKTTLFTAMRICLYGFLSMGYKNYNAYYTRAVSKLINNNAKLSKPAQASVALEIEMPEGNIIQKYLLKRSWVLEDALVENFEVKKNHVVLNEEETADFEKYIHNILPPELFNLYFFDGEHIADFFLEEGGDSRVKDAFLTLCGYDTFEIMGKNFKRVFQTTSNGNSTTTEYLGAQSEYKSILAEYEEIKLRNKDCIEKIGECDAAIRQLDTEYNKAGGVTSEEWNKKLAAIKCEEKFREEQNAWLKKMANDMIPFLLVTDLIKNVRTQIEAEQSNQKYENFCDILSDPDIGGVLGNSAAGKKKIKAAIDVAKEKYSSNSKAILYLSSEEMASVISDIKRIDAFDSNEIYKAKESIKKSLSKSNRLKSALEKSNIDSVEHYMEKRAELFENKSNLLKKQNENESQLRETEIKLQESELKYSKLKSKLEDELKQQSIVDMASKAIIMLDSLKGSLYQKEKAAVEDCFRIKIKSLMRKKSFIDDIYIDNDFGVHIYRNETLPTSQIKNLIRENNKLIKTQTFKKLMQLLNVKTEGEFYQVLWNTPVKEFTLPWEIDKSSLSNGEKQIFIMTLYYSLINLRCNSVPFVIDTPFARIDTEHRRNIAKHFFSELSGQVFILSTNEEINSTHVKIMENKIAERYLLENNDNKKTNVIEGSYF